MAEEEELGGLDDLDLGDLDIGEGGGEGEGGGDTGEGLDLDALGDDALDAGGEDAGGEGLDLGDLEAELGGGDSGEAAEASGGEDSGEAMDFGDLEAELGTTGEDAGGGGEAMDMDSELAGLMGGEESGGGSESAPAPPPAPPTAAEMGFGGSDSVNINFLLDIKLNVTFEVGRAKMLISDLLTLGQGSVIELHRLVGDELDFLVNGQLIAKGEVVVINEKFGCKITDIISPEDRIKHLGGY